jgi:hypothetical protein
MNAFSLRAVFTYIVVFRIEIPTRIFRRFVASFRHHYDETPNNLYI